MFVVTARNVHDALPKALSSLHIDHIKRESRNGPVLQAPTTVSTIYSRPWERVMFHPWRDANPFFHFYESLWMLAGREDVAPLTRYVKRMADFSDDGKSFNAAYGARWRSYVFGVEHGDLSIGDQLRMIIEELKENQDSRRCVLQIWDPQWDLCVDTKDAACNLVATFQLTPRRFELDTYRHALDMTVFCRSNDIIWGCYGANAVHFSMLMEYIARGIGAPMGLYTQISVNWHAYEEVFTKTYNRMLNEFEVLSDYPDTYPLVTMGVENWDSDVRRFITEDGKAPRDIVKFDDPFFYTVAFPIIKAHDIYKDNTGEARFTKALDMLASCGAADWRKACKEWIQRRYMKWQKEADDGPAPV